MLELIMKYRSIINGFIRRSLEFDPVLFFWSLRKSRNNHNQLKKLSESIFGKNVYLLGSGPSLDKVDLSKIKDSVVVFLNYSYLNHQKLSSSNKFFWMCIHTTVIEKAYADVPNYITNIIIPNSYWNFSGVKGASKGNSIYLHPKPSLKLGRILPSPSNVKLNSDDNSIVQRAGIKLYPFSVMLNAIFLCLYCGSKKITCLGFDAPPKSVSSSPYSYAKGLPNSNKNSGFDLSQLESYLCKLLRYANSVGSSVVNCSPGSYISVMPKSDELL